MSEDASNGYEAIVDEYIAVRSRSGRTLVQSWAEELGAGASIVDLGAGYGEPITSILLETGLKVSAIEASSSMVAEFRARFPDVEVACEPVETSAFFGRQFDAALAVGLIFLLPEETQGHVINRVANALRFGGSFLFSAPVETGVWDDLLTGRRSVSLGEAAYYSALEDAGFAQIENRVDDAGAHYFSARKA